MQPFKEIWDLALKELTDKYGATISDLWFTCLTLYEISQDRAIVITDMPYKYGIIKSKYVESISAALEKVLGFKVEVVVLDKIANPEEYNQYVKAESTAAAEPVNLADRVSVPSHENDETKKEKGADLSDISYTFDNFIVGESNKFAHAASVAVANEPVCKSNSEFSTYNPLFIHGPSGLGKTHLLYAIINKIKSTRPELKIVYVKGEEFTNQLIDSIAKKNPMEFREKYRTADVLLIDDIQFIAGRDSTQEEFFHTFNALYEDQKQIILTSDRPPRDIQTLEDRLKTRFEWGIMADIQPPDSDLRAAILKKKAADLKVTLDDDVINFLAENLKSNIRQVEGAIKKLRAHSYLMRVPITVDLAKTLISDLMTNEEPTSVTVDRILNTVAKKYGTTVENIKGTRRTREIAFARHISVYLLRKLTDLSLPQIGKCLGRDHTTIISSLRTVEKELGANTQTNADVKELLKEISGK